MNQQLCVGSLKSETVLQQRIRPDYSKKSQE